MSDRALVEATDVAGDPPISDRALVEATDVVFASVGRSQRALLAHAAEIHRRGFHERDGAHSAAAWISTRYGVSTWAARRWINAGHSLPSLPLIAETLDRGRLSLDKVVELVRFATPETEAKLITWARRVTAATIRARADREARKDIEEVQAADKSRYFRWWTFDEGDRIGFEGAMPVAEGARIVKAVTRLAGQIEASPTDTEELEHAGIAVSEADTFEARCADALSWMASQAIVSQSDIDRATVVVHAALGSDTGAYIEDGPALHPEVARRISCDARLAFVLEDPHNKEALGIGHASRVIPRWLWRQLKHRDDGCCQFPGCGRRALLQGHHIWHWEDGGPTELWNLLLVCHFHHKLVHDFGWSVWRGDGEAAWYRPDGRRFEPGPAPPAQEREDREDREDLLPVAV